MQNALQKLEKRISKHLYTDLFSEKCIEAFAKNGNKFFKFFFPKVESYEQFTADKDKHLEIIKQLQTDYSQHIFVVLLMTDKNIMREMTYREFKQNFAHMSSHDTKFFFDFLSKDNCLFISYLNDLKCGSENPLDYLHLCMHIMCNVPKISKDIYKAAVQLQDHTL